MPEPVSLENYTEEQRANLARLGHTLLTNPEVAAQTKRLIKKVNPQAQFPDIDIEDRFETLKQEQQAQRDKDHEAERVRRSNEAYERTRGAVVARGHKIEDVEKVMKDKGIANYDTAMELMEAQQQLAAPTAESLTSMQMPSETKEIMKDPRGWSNRMAHGAIDELRKRRA